MYGENEIQNYVKLQLENIFYFIMGEFGYLEIFLKKDKVYNWQLSKGVYFKGSIENSRNFQLIFRELDINQNLLEQFLTSNKQYFSLLFKNDSYVVAAVDHLRMFPIFYGEKEGSFYLSDKPEWIRAKLDDKTIDQIALSEFRMTGYVTGRNTLYSNIKQLQAGEYLIFNIKTKELIVKDYFCDKKRDKKLFQKEDAFKELDDIHLSIFNHLIKSINNRPIVVPLSAGYDSRIIVMMLKRLQYENVICITYGKTGNWEAKISKEIAEKLGYEWIFVPYTSRKWKEWYDSKSSENLMKYSNGLTSLTHIQDHLAFLELKEKGLIPLDSIIIPGHTAMLSFSGYPENCNSIEQCADALLEKHYSLWKWSYKNGDEFKQNLKHKVVSLVSSTNEYYGNIEDSFYLWEIRERHAKFICNSVRAYEHLGYEWRLPLWEKELVDFWLKTPQVYRKSKQFYKDYYKWKFEGEVTGLSKPNNDVIRKKNPLKDQIKKYGTMFDLLKRLKEFYGYYNHPLDWYKIVPFHKYTLGFVKGAANINSFFIAIQIKIIKKM